MTASEAVALAAFVRWANLLAMAAVIGALVTELVVLPRDAALDAEYRVRRSRFAALALLVVATGADLVWRARTMAGGGIDATAAAIPAVLARTHFGVDWRVRASAIALVVILCTVRRRAAHATALAAMLVVVFTLAASGHAADWGDLTATTLVDWAHASAAFTWGGGLLCSWWCVFRDPGALPPTILLAATRRFSRLASVCVGVVVLSGIANASVQVASIGALATSAYGRVLSLKLLLAAGALALGAVNRYRVLPALSIDRAARARADDDLARGASPGVDRDGARGLARYVACEVATVVIVFACTAVLGELAPPRHAETMHGAGAVATSHAGG